MHIELELERKKRGTLHQGELRKIEAIIATAFCHGLSPEIRCEVPPSGYADFLVASAHTQATTRLNERYAERRNREERERYSPRNEPLVHSTPMRYFMPPRQSVHWRDSTPPPDRHYREGNRYRERPQQRDEAPRGRFDDSPPPSPLNQ